MPLEFSYKYFEQLLDTAADHGYVITSFEAFDASRPRTIIMRHDVDYTLGGVYELAAIEFHRGCTASYLFRVHADEYNLFSCTATALVKELRRMGHEVGLHFEAMNVSRALDLDPPSLLLQEKQVIEAIIGSRVRTCSEHRELSGLVHRTPLFEQLYDPYLAGFDFYAMDRKFSKDMKYLSDSNAIWREGDPFQHFGKHARMQILIHADWWFERDLLLKGPYVHPRGTHI
jgi:hypothetical protein